MVFISAVRQCGQLPRYSFRVTPAVARTISSTCYSSCHNRASISTQTRPWKGHLRVSNSVQTTLYTQNQSFFSTSRSLVQQNEKEDVQELPEFKLFFRLPSIVVLRVLSRVKIAQTCLTVALLPPLSYYHSIGVFTTSQLQFSVGVATFALFMLYAMSFYLRRVIGAMYLHRDGDMVKVSHLTFWGKRRDILVPIEDIVPLGESTNRTGEVFARFERYSTNDILYFTPRFGYFVHSESFLKVFGTP